ncbi:hypothetical protein Emed_000245 [Eimeria media]
MAVESQMCCWASPSPSGMSGTPRQNAECSSTCYLQEGLQGRVASGFVELTLNNSQRRLCMYDSDEVVLRRVFSLTTDDYFVQGKHLRSATFWLLLCFPVPVVSLLSLLLLPCLPNFNISARLIAFSGGLRGSRGSSSKSSFIIRQGRIQEDRLKLLMAAGGGGFLQAKAEETETILQQAGPAAFDSNSSNKISATFTPRVAGAGSVDAAAAVGSENLSSLYVTRSISSSIRSISSTAAEDECAERLNVKKALGDLKTNIEAMDSADSRLEEIKAYASEKSAWRETTAALRAAEEQQTVSNSTAACIRAAQPQMESSLRPHITSISSNNRTENLSFAAKHRNAIRRLAAAAAEAEAARDEAATQREAACFKGEQSTAMATSSETLLSASAPLIVAAAVTAADCAVTAQQDLQAGMRENAENAGRDLQVQETHLRLENAAAAERAAAQHQRHIKARQQLEEKHQEMQKIQTEINETLRPKHAAATAAYRAAQQQHAQVQQQLQQLQRRAAQSGSSTAGRLAAIRQQIREAEQQQRLDEEQGPAKQQKRTELQRELEAAETAAAEASAAAAAAAETVKQTTKQINSLREPLSDVVERLRQQQGKLSALLQQQISVKAKLQAATGQPKQRRQGKRKPQQQRHPQQPEMGSGSICSSTSKPLSVQRTSEGHKQRETVEFSRGTIVYACSLPVTCFASDAFWRLLPSDSAWSLNQVEALAEREGWKNANPKSAAGILANFVEVDAEYQRAVEAVGGFCFWHFVVPDSAHALEAVARLKQQQQQQQQQQRGAMGLRPQRRCCLSLLPLKEVAEQQRQRQQLSVRRKQQQQLAQRLLEQGVAMPLMECIRLSDAAPAAPETSGELELFLRSVFGSVLLVPSLDSQEVSQWNQQGFDCVNLDGDIAFASGAMRGGGTKGGKLTAYFRSPHCDTKLANLEHKPDSEVMREAQKADEKLTSDLKAQQEALKTLQQEQKKLVEREQILSEEKLKAQLQVEAHVAAQQRANMYRWLMRAVAAFGSAKSPLVAAVAVNSCVPFERIARRFRAAAAPPVSTLQGSQGGDVVVGSSQGGRRSKSRSHPFCQTTAANARPGALTSQEKQKLQQLHRQQQQQQQELQQLLRRVEETAAALSQAEDAVEVSLRRAVERLEREANEAEGEAWDPEATDRLQAEIESTSKKRQQEEENAAEVESRLRALENELAAARKSQEAAEVSLQSLLQQLDGETALLQQTQHTVDSLKRMQADAASLVAAAAAAAGSTAAAAAARAPLAAQSREALHSKLSEIKEKLAEFPHVNRKAVAELATIKDDFAALQRRDSLQEETLSLLQQQLQQLQRRRQQLLQQLLRKVDIEFTSLFSQLVPGGHAKLELVQQDSQSPVMGAEASGLEIRANFRAQANGAEERLSMQRLSGGAVGNNNSSSSSSGLTYSSSSSKLISSSDSGSYLQQQQMSSDGGVVLAMQEDRRRWLRSPCC